MLRGKLKGFFYGGQLHRLFGWMAQPMRFAASLSDVSRWIAKRDKETGFSDFYSFSFDYEKRLRLYEYVYETEQLGKEPFDYLEFGVANGNSFSWWIDKDKQAESGFYGFDTFTGLPENWGYFKKGDMTCYGNLPNINDSRAVFYKGLFQETLWPFMAEKPLDRRKIIHLDADLYSATWFVLASLAPRLRKGDILLFDEFNVPLHEFKAFKEFTESFYIEYKVLGAVNNYFQVAIKIC